ncbi:MAG: S8 family serine peptidase [Rhizobiaceae bacterium]
MAALAVNFVALPSDRLEFGASSAYADDDDDDDGDDDDYRRPPPRRYLQRNWSPGREYRRAAPRRAPAQRVRPAPRQPVAAPRPAYEPRIIIATGLDEGHIAALTSAGFEIVTRRQLAGGELLKIRTPQGLAMDAARARVAASPSATADFNHYYHPSQDRRCGGKPCIAPALVGWPSVGARCSSDDIVIGMVDTGINPDHPVFHGKQLELLRLEEDLGPGSGKQHGTAVASLLIGGGDVGTPGLLPDARLVAIDAFEKFSRSEDRAEAFQLVRSLETLSRRNVQIINMSLSGPANALLEQAVNRIVDSNIVVVAAAGNAGPSAAPAYPAGYARVLAVTAIDRNKRAYRRANRGGHIDIAAPGVGVWAAASIKGTRQKTGTSIATPFVTAAAALVLSAEPGSSAEQIAQRLAATAQDLGDPGRDDIYGWGLLDVSAFCR